VEHQSSAASKWRRNGCGGITQRYGGGAHGAGGWRCIKRHQALAKSISRLAAGGVGGAAAAAMAAASSAAASAAASAKHRQRNIGVAARRVLAGRIDNSSSLASAARGGAAAYGAMAWLRHMWRRRRQSRGARSTLRRVASAAWRQRRGAHGGHYRRKNIGSNGVAWRQHGGKRRRWRGGGHGVS